MYTFWYRFVEPNQGAIENFNGKLVYHQYVKPMLSHFMGPVFETMAAQYVQAVSYTHLDVYKRQVYSRTIDSRDSHVCIFR